MPHMPTSHISKPSFIKSCDRRVEKLKKSNFSKRHRTTEKVDGNHFSRTGVNRAETRRATARRQKVKVLIARQTRRSTSFGVNSWRVSDRQSRRVKPVARRWCESAFTDNVKNM